MVGGVILVVGCMETKFAPKASNPKSRREIHLHQKPSGNRLFFNFEERDRK